jgi:TolB-like protein
MRAAVASIVTLLVFCTALFAAPAAPVPAEPSVLILPFSSVAEPGNIALAKGIQHDLAATLAFGKLRIVTPNIATGAPDAESALKSARDVDATIVIFGQSQAAGSNLRLTGQVLDVATGKSLGGLIATGASDDLFHMEDVLGAQAMWALPPTMRHPEALQKAIEIARQMREPTQPATATTPTVVVVPSGGQNYTYPAEPFPAYPASYPTAPYYDPYTAAYPYDFFDDGFGFSPVVVFSNFDRFGFHRFDHRFNNHAFSRFGGFHSRFNSGFNHGFGGFNGAFHSGGFNGGFHSGGFHGGFHSGGMMMTGGFGGHR